MASYGRMPLCFLLTALTIQYYCVSHTTNAKPVNGSAKHVLLDRLTSNYPKMGKFAEPRLAVEPVYVKMLLTIPHITAVDREKQSVSFRSEIFYEWRDDFLSWDPDEYQGLTKIQVPAEKIWIPRIQIIEILTETCTGADSIMVNNKGEVSSLPCCISEIRCATDITFFPFDKQTCKYSMTSWPQDNQTLVIEEFHRRAFVHNLAELRAVVGVLASEVHPSARQTSALKSAEFNQGLFDWEIDNVNSDMDWFTEAGLTYPIVTVTFVIHHRVPLFAFLLVLPAALLSALTSVVFLLPSYNESKVEIGLSIFLSFMVLLNILMDATPGSSHSVPLIAYYFTVNSLLIAMSVFCATVVLRVHNKSTSSRVMSPCLKRLTLFMAKVLRVRTEIKPSDTMEFDDLTPAVKMVDTKIEKRPARNNWLLLASVLDRIFFIVYLIVNITATLIVFIRYREDKHSWE